MSVWCHFCMNKWVFKWCVSLASRMTLSSFGIDNFATRILIKEDFSIRIARFLPWLLARERTCSVFFHLVAISSPHFHCIRTDPSTSSRWVGWGQNSEEKRRSRERPVSQKITGAGPNSRGAVYRSGLSLVLTSQDLSAANAFTWMFICFHLYGYN